MEREFYIDDFCDGVYGYDGSFCSEEREELLREYERDVQAGEFEWDYEYLGDGEWGYEE
jgi:hypothetical protein